VNRLNIESVNRVADAYLETVSGSDAGRLSFLKGLWEIQSEAEQAAVEYQAPDAEAAREALKSGKSLFFLAAPAVPLAEYVELVTRIAAYTADAAGLPEEQADALRSTDFAAAITEELLTSAVSGLHAFEAAVSEALAPAGEALTQATLRFVLVSALVPFLTGPAETTLAAVGIIDRTLWSSGNCPVCGSAAAMGRLGESTTLQGAERTLWCSLCNAEWSYERLRCVRCGTRNPDKLRYTHVESDPVHRIHLCDECHGYAKFIAMNDLKKPLSMPVEDAVSANMDGIAVEKGYTATGDASGQAQ
jgi:FdhE protein